MSMPPQQMQQQLDDERSAKQSQVPDNDEVVYEQMVAGLRNHVFGKGEQGIVDRLSSSTSAAELTKAIGETTFILVQEAAHQAEENGVEFDIETLMAVATQLIEDISDLMEGHGKPIPEEVAGDAMMMAVQLYVESSNPSDEERAAATQQLAMQREDGSLDEAVTFVQKRGMENGADPFGTEQMATRPGMMGQPPSEE